MASLISTLSIFLQPVALTVSLVYLYGAIGRWKQSERMRNLALGSLFGLGTIISMTAPITLADGLIFDLRNLLVGMACALLGPLAGIVTLAMGIVTRVMIGGQGAMLGVAGMCVSAGMAILWHFSVRRSHLPSDASLVLLGAMISAHILVGLLLPSPFREVFITQLAPIVLIANLVCAWVLGRLIIRERHLRIELSDLRTAAETDPLTNLLNRRSLIEVVEHLKPTGAARTGRVMLCFDVDRFKSINDIYGHLSGDQILQCISERIKSCLRPGDVFARLGGDEFVVLLPDVSRDTATIVAERCRTAVCSKPFQVDDRSIPVTISMGATFSNGPASFDALLRSADEALYAAKADGRNCVALDKSFETAEGEALQAA